MKKQFSFIFLFFAIILAIFVGSNTHLVDTFDPSVNEQNISQNNIIAGNFEVQTAIPQNGWYMGFDKKFFSENDDICVKWTLDEKSYTECLDVEHSDSTQQYYTFPVITRETNAISVEILHNGKKLQNIENISVYSINTLPNGKKLTFSIQKSNANINVISRAEWGADETIRYVTHPRQIEAHRKNLAYLARPKTAAELKNIAHTTAINAFLNKELFPEFSTVTMTRTENGNKLVWPIQKVKKVNKIVVHHTAESLERNLPDEQLIRAIYSYHAITRGWGDIGYNFIVGQTGKIYEWRAGGDYVVGAHASYNNIGSVGISVLGNYEKNTLNPDQEKGLKAIIDHTAQKYGITLTDTVKWYKRCSTATCYPIQVVYTPALLGHRDVGVTNCPGQHIYKLLPKWRSELAKNTTPILNNDAEYIEEKPASENNNLTPKNPVTSDLFANTNNTFKAVTVTNLTPTIKNVTTEVKSSVDIRTNGNEKTTITSTENNAPKNTENTPKQAMTTRYFWKKFRVKLSYPHNNISLSAYANTNATAFLDYARKPIFPGTKITIEPTTNNQILLKIGEIPYTLKNFSFSAPVVQIDSWTRVPEWNKSGQYNDNTFRDTIEIFNENGKLVVVNHLPLEWYLKGLGEVSNGDLPEKIKTITVAARGYASFYMERENRKYNTNRYDGSDDPNSFQKYLGYSYENRSPNVAKMVDATAGEVIYYQGKLIKPWYFSSSNGKTLSYKEYCQKNNGKNCEDIAYLQSVSDPAGTAQSGHGVGISGIGATNFARQWWDYKKIIQYYMNGVEIRK